jgi:hypothetical protein
MRLQLGAYIWLQRKSLVVVALLLVLASRNSREFREFRALGFRV